MACTGCARRRAKLKRLMDLANERFEELKQRIAGAEAVEADNRERDRRDDGSDHPARGQTGR